MSNVKAERLLSGTVVSNKMQKTVVVEVLMAYKHPRFGKIVRKAKKYKVHDESEVARPGDKVEFHEVAPISKTKYMRLVRVV